MGVQVFNEYLQDISAVKAADSSQRVACCGDCAVKVVHRNGMEFEAPRALTLTLTLTLTLPLTLTLTLTLTLWTQEVLVVRLWPRAAWSPRRVSTRPHAPLVCRRCC